MSNSRSRWAEYKGTGSASGRDCILAAPVTPLLSEALARWQAAGVDTAGLGNLQVRITDLGGTTLGLASGNIIYLDSNAAGWG